MTRKTINTIQIATSLMSYWDRSEYEELTANGEYVDQGATQGAYQVALRDQLERLYPEAEIVFYSHDNFLYGHGSATVVVDGQHDSTVAAEVADVVARVFAQIDRLTVRTHYTVTECTPDEISATDLRGGIAQAAANGDRSEAARVTVDGHAEVIEVLYLPATQRAGLAWGADADWTDAESLEEGVQRFLAGQMQN